LDKEIFNYAYGNHQREMEILMSVPGIGELGAAFLIAEIYNLLSAGRHKKSIQFFY
jgi:transposase